jgi:pyruvate dehydrogenase E2 component (dihydrolipoamide acetyltransferase)
MPKMNQTSEDCTIVKWRKQEGETVTKGEVLFEIETDKAVLEVESFFEGTLLKIVVPEGIAVPVQSTVAFIGKTGETPPTVAPPPATAPTPAKAPPTPAPHLPSAVPPAVVPVAASQPAPVAAPPPSPAPLRHRLSPRARALVRSAAIGAQAIRGTGPGGRIVERDVRAYLAASGYAKLRITPAAKELAIKEGIDILAVRGTGEDGRIVQTDVERALRERPQPLSRMRQVIAQRLTHSVTTAPHFFVTVAVDMTDLLAYRMVLKQQQKPYSVTDFILLAVVRSLVEFPTINSMTTDGKTARWSSSVHLGLATSLDDGLVVPVIRNAQDLSLDQLHEAAANLAAKARAGKLAPDEMTGSTFTISNMGMLNVDNFTAIINPGESAILAVSSALEQPAVRKGAIVIRTIMNITLSSDHRLIDGALAAKFINAVKTKLEDLKLCKHTISW